MNFLIEKKLLYQSLQKIVGIVSVRPRLPILTHILLEVDKNFLFMTATDLEIEITTKIFLNDASNLNGLSTVSGRKFFDICRGFSEYSKIFVELKHNKLRINSKSSNFVLSVFSSSDFPKLESLNEIIELEISQVILKKMLELTQFAMGNQDVRYYLNGIFFEIKETNIRVVATDGHRLAVCSVSIDTLSLFHSMIIPRKGVCEILRLLSTEKESLLVNIQTNKHSICLKTKNYTITSKLIDAVFPSYRNILIKQSKNILEVECDNLMQALKRAAIIANEKLRVVQFVVMNNVLKIIARNVENEMSQETLDIVYEGQNMEISFNINYLLDILNVMNTKIVRFLLNDALSGVQIEGVTKYYDETYIVMPVRI